jgi:hypothetical protein
MLDYLAYQTAQRRVAELARGALPDSPVRFPEVASHPACPRASRSPRAATDALLRGLASLLNRSRRLAPSRPSPRPRQSALHPAVPQPPIGTTHRDRRPTARRWAAGQPSS